MINPPIPRSRHERYDSTPSFPLPLLPAPSSFTTDAHPTLTTDLETHTYASPRQRRVIQSLSATYSKRNGNMVGRAPHYQGIRHHPDIIPFINAARDYDQELLDLRFKLAGPTAVHFLTLLDAEKAIASLGRASAILTNATWRVRRSEDLWEIQSACEETGEEVWCYQLAKIIDSGKVDAELACHGFWSTAMHDFHQLIGQMKNEAQYMQSVVASIEQNRELPFLREQRQKSKKARNPPPPPPPVDSAKIPTNTFSSVPCALMSGALPVDDADKPSWASSLKARLAKTKSSNPLGIDFAVLALKARYQVLKAQERWRGGESPEASRDAWVAFRASLWKYPGPHFTDVIILTYKTDTRILLAERQIEPSVD
ncbi:uncharacterized protein GGS22DRAFT_198831 [Annulohypoxylon maeteangense]|uniref:uncharacterized protein n=1 Tax=Annulohypoxylon maeteangense TaxID=1927788 RepID=UPI002007F26E|nr:uncharacterized protein GGS22DRAFT_198831 [Annulohypoxylon maeteangense]KAI0887644.1 hypothetical protein GGS22DRAFT_198831 [Annulohypoxylon maeteangense]